MKVEGESPRVWGFHSRESVALLLTYSLFGVIPRASVNTEENLVSAGSQPLAMACLGSASQYSKRCWGIYSWSLTAPLRGVLYHRFAHSSGKAVRGIAFHSQRVHQCQSQKEKTWGCLVLSSLCSPPDPAASSAEC